MIAYCEPTAGNAPDHRRGVHGGDVEEGEAGVHVGSAGAIVHQEAVVPLGEEGEPLAVVFAVQVGGGVSWGEGNRACIRTACRGGLFELLTLGTLEREGLALANTQALAIPSTSGSNASAGSLLMARWISS